MALLGGEAVALKRSQQQGIPRGAARQIQAGDVGVLAKPGVDLVALVIGQLDAQEKLAGALGAAQLDPQAVADGLEELRGRRDSGEITDEEYEQAREQLRRY